MFRLTKVSFTLDNSFEYSEIVLGIYSLVYYLTPAPQLF